MQELAPLPRILIGYIAGPNIPTDTTKPNAIKAVGEFLDVDYLVRQIVEIEAVPASGNTQQNVSMQVDMYDAKCGLVVFHVAARTTKGDEPEQKLATRLCQVTLCKLPGFTSRQADNRSKVDPNN